MSDNHATPWRAAAGLSVDQLTAWGILYYAYTILSEPMAADLGLQNHIVAAAFSVCLLTSGLLAPYVGRWSDRHGSRGLMVSGAGLGCLSMVAMGAVTGPAALGAVFVLLGVAQSLSLYEPAFVAILDWFPEARARQRAWLLLTCVGGLASTVFLPATALAVESFGWRLTAIGLGCVLGLLVAPARLWLPRRQAQARTRPVAVSQSPPRLRSVVWLARTFAVQAFASTGVTLYLVWHQVERGHDVAAAAVIAGLAGAAQVPGRLLLATLQPRVPTHLRLPLLLWVQAAAVLTLTGSSGATAMGGVLVFGAASGMMTLERATVLVQWYGPKRFGARNGRVVALAAAAKAAAPVAVTTAHEAVSYTSIYCGLAGMLVVSGSLAIVAARARARESQPG